MTPRANIVTGVILLHCSAINIPEKTRSVFYCLLVNWSFPDAISSNLSHDSQGNRIRN